MNIFDDAIIPGVDPELLRAQIEDDVSEALESPLGTDRLERLKQLAQLAYRHGLDALEASIRLEIVWDSLEAGDTEYSLATFSWVLQQFSHHPPDEQQLRVIAVQMLQLPVLAARHCGVDAELIERLLFWMGFFAQEAQLPFSGRLSSRHQVELGLGSRAAARETLDMASALEQITHEVSSESDCPLHHYRSRIAWAVNSMDYPRALELYHEARQRCEVVQWHCLQPDDINPLLMMPLAWAGEGNAAWKAHERSYRHQSEASQYLGDIASHLRFCASTWAIAEGLEILKSHAHWFTNPEDPWDLLVATRAGATFLTCAVGAYVGAGFGVPSLDFCLPGENRWLPFETLQPSDSLAVAQARLEQVSRKLSLSFDGRNSNNSISTRTREHLHEVPLCAFPVVKTLLKTRFSVQCLLQQIGISESHAHWALPPLDTKSELFFPPQPDYHQLSSTAAQERLTRFENLYQQINFATLPGEISAKKEQLVLGVDRVALLVSGGCWEESLAAQSAGFDSLLAQAEIELIVCYLDGRNPGKALEVFSSTLARLLHRPELYDTRQLAQLGRCFPRVVTAGATHPDVPLSLVNHLLVGWEAYAECLAPSAGEAYYLRHTLREALGFSAEEYSFLDQAIDAVGPSDPRFLTRAVDIAQIEFAATEHPQAALQVAWRMLTHEIPAPQKARLLRAMLPALVTGQAWQVAWEAHLVAYEWDRENARLADLALHLRFLAVTGLWHRLLRLLERHLGLFAQLRPIG